MNGVKLQTAHHKTEVLLVSNCKSIQRIEIDVGGHASSEAPRSDDRQPVVPCRLWLREVREGDKCNNEDHAKMSVARKAAQDVSLKTKRNLEKLNRAFRLIVIRVTRAYRTISSEAASVIAGMIPIYITLAEDIECYQRRTTRNERTMVRIDSMAKWQQEWDGTEKGRWAHRFIPH
ncbi:uncharacterized protein LOC131439178 [Malaya genurostris]|uniref:uncharacterized protein LOC131439178 n=1 Tax=Malaya genurostris TaxID=325434 RepID=UPI0026F3F557|nr:uncharacterized protein LOC131439178 [Malaya genurostris]